MRRSNFALRVPPTLLAEARKAAESEGVALNQLITLALAEKVSAMRPLSGPNCFSSILFAGVSNGASARPPLPPIPNFPTGRIGRGHKFLPGLLRETAPHRSARGRSSPPEAAVALPRAPSRTGTVWLLYPFGPSPLPGPQLGRWGRRSARRCR
ncbi:MAG: hypothetical protein DMG30_13210 [Acidobacteria bacterium]|nr:MAG: hypothetical protein DMG30_13210 [Acidobacteriota bacterium]